MSFITWWKSQLLLMSLTLLLSSNSAFLSKQMEDVQQLQGQTKELLIGNFNRLFEMV